MSKEQKPAAEAENEQETGPTAAQAPVSAETDTTSYVIRVSHTDSRYVGPFRGRQAAEAYLDAKRAQDAEGRWAPGRVEVVSAAAAHAAKEEAEARKLLGR